MVEYARFLFLGVFFRYDSHHRGGGSEFWGGGLQEDPVWSQSGAALHGTGVRRPASSQKNQEGTGGVTQVSRLIGDASLSCSKRQMDSS